MEGGGRKVEDRNYWDHDLNKEALNELHEYLFIPSIPFIPFILFILFVPLIILFFKLCLMNQMFLATKPTLKRVSLGYTEESLKAVSQNPSIHQVSLDFNKDSGNLFNLLMTPNPLHHIDDVTGYSVPIPELINWLKGIYNIFFPFLIGFFFCFPFRFYCFSFHFFSFSFLLSFYCFFFFADIYYV